MVTVRDATDADRDAVCDLHRTAIRQLASAAYEQEVVDAWAGPEDDRDPSGYPVGEAGVEFVVCAVDGTLAGFGDLTGVDPADYEVVDRATGGETGEIRAVYVHPEFARQGVGTAILSELEHRAREREFRTLVLTGSLNAVPFYEHHGYDAVAEVTHEFGGEVPGTAVVMRKSLPTAENE